MKNILILTIALFSYSITQAQEVGTKKGMLAPELAYENPNGEIMKLSELRGKVVIIDFWASWCGPCRRENPHVVALYEQHKNTKFVNGDGLEIYSLSLDKNKASWLKAMTADKLFWKYHVSDLKGWDAEGAALYGVRSIPQTYILDGDGIIIAKNLRGAALDNFLESIKAK
jgi:thiol-disulfide isomerase/thioredoxin